MAKAKKKAPVKSRPKNSSFWKSRPYLPIWIGLAVTAVIFTWVRYQYIDIAFERDEGAYGYLGWMALSGGTPYVDFFEMKPPLLFYSYALIIALFGKTPIGFHIAAAIITWVNSWMCYRIGRDLVHPVAGLVCASAYFIISTNFQASGYAMQGEHIVNIFGLSGLAVLTHAFKVKKNWVYFVSGLLFAASILTKQNGIFFGFAGASLLILQWIPWSEIDKKTMLKQHAFWILGGLSLALLCVLWLTRHWKLR